MEGGDWQPLLQSVLLGLIFSYLLAKLISIVVSFKEDNLSITRAASVPEPDPVHSDEDDVPVLRHVDDSVAAKKRSVGSSEAERDDDDDDDWEGVESTELDELFSAATVFVAAAAAEKTKVSTEKQLMLYGLYKIATEGPCSSPQPSALKMTARAKWQAWQKLGAMPAEEAMVKYLDIVSELYPTWADGLVVKSRGGDGSSGGKDSKGPMGPVFSTFIYEEGSENDFKMEDIHAFAREGEVDNLLKCIDSGVSVDAKDSEGRTPLHWAVDRGHLHMAEVLVSRNADVNAKSWKDNEGQTALHYAAVCDREGIAEYLVKENADTEVEDNDDNSPSDLCESKWSWLQRVRE